jgi:hypothetical protein
MKNEAARNPRRRADRIDPGRLDMKKAVFAALILALFWSCETVTGPKDSGKPNVIMVEGPTLVGGPTSFKYTGRVQNQGTATAGFTKIIIHVFNSSGSQLAQAETNLVDVALEKNESSTWEVTFSDGDHKIQDALDKNKTTYEIKWE